MATGDCLLPRKQKIVGPDSIQRISTALIGLPLGSCCRRGIDGVARRAGLPDVKKVFPKSPNVSLDVFLCVLFIICEKPSGGKGV